MPIIYFKKSLTKTFNLVTPKEQVKCCSLNFVDKKTFLYVRNSYCEIFRKAKIVPQIIKLERIKQLYNNFDRSKVNQEKKHMPKQ